MKKGRILIQCLIILLCLPAANTFSQSSASKIDIQQTPEKPLDAFIRHVAETNTFVQVSNIWTTDDQFDKTAILQNVTKAQPLTIDYTAVAALIQKNTIAISLVVPGINGGTYTIDLAQYSPLNNSFEVHSKAGDVETPVAYTPGKYYSGIVHGIPGSVAAFSFFNNEVYGIFSIPGVGNMVLVPNTMVGKYYDYNQHYILYNDFDLTIKDRAPKCGTDQLNDYTTIDNTASKTTTTPNNNVYMNCNVVNVMELGDYQLYRDHGNSVPNATNYLTALFNNQATVYRNELVIINLKYVQINSATDVYQTLASSSSTFLNAFGDDIQNTYRTVHGCNLALLATTRYGSMGGVAWLNALCGTYSASSHFDGTGICNIDNATVSAFPTYSWNVEVLSHEMGHMVGSKHTHNCSWNPQYTGTTVIDGCYTLEGGCANPGLPPVGTGTVMSYCHLTSVGINLANGFGPQPGIVIRNYINSTAPAGQPRPPGGCINTIYTPSTPLQTANRTVAANRECTDMASGITYYWKDNNTADQSDDTLILMVKKNGNTIGDLNTAGFSVTANTIVRYGSGTGDTLVFPSGMPASILAQNYGMRRYWKIVPTSTPTTPVEVIFPFMSTDTADVHGSVIGPAPITSYLMYKVNDPIDPNPYNNFPGSTSGNFQIYTYGAAASTTNWSLTTVGTTQLAHMQMTNLKGGGTGFYTYCNGLAAPTVVTAPPAPCPGTTVTYSVTPDPLAVSYTWTVAGSGWTGSSTGPSIVLTAGSGVATITVAANAACGSGYITSFNITPAPLPTVTIAPSSGLCTTDPTASFIATVTGGGPATAYTWTVTGTGWTPSGSTSLASFTANAGTGVGVVKVHATNVCGNGPDVIYNASMTNTAPVTPTSITPPALACPSSTGVFTTPAITGATSYNWTVSGTGWSGTSTTNSINVNIGTGLGTLTVSASNSCGTSAGTYSRGFSTSTGPGPATAIIAPDAPCGGTSAVLSTPAVASASSYNWVVTGTGWSGSSSTSTINVTVGSGPGIVTVTPINACGSGGSYTTTITPAAAPVSSFALSSHIVPVNTDIIAIFNGSAPVGSTYAWNFSGGVGTPGTGSGAQTIHWTTAGQYIVFLTVSNGAGCSSAYADTVHVGSTSNLNNLNVDKIEASIIPNPNNGAFDILFTNPITKSISVKLFDMQGRVVYNNDFKDAINKKISIETDNLPQGTYTVTVYMNEFVISRKITILR